MKNGYCGGVAHDRTGDVGQNQMKAFKGTRAGAKRHGAVEMPMPAFKGFRAGKRETPGPLPVFKGIRKGED